MVNAKIKGSLPKDREANGMGEEAVKAILAEPRKPVVCILVLQAEAIDQALDSGTFTPTMRITRIERVTDAEEAGDLVRRAQALSEDRTGEPSLDVEVESAYDETLSYSGSIV